MFDADDLGVGHRLAGLDPVIERRRSGDTFIVKSLGVTMTFVQMPHWRLSYWEGTLAMPGPEISVELVFDAERDEPPNAGHEVIVLGARRMQIWQTASALPLINRKLLELGHDQVTVDDCVLSSIRVGHVALLDYDLGFSVRNLPLLDLIVAHRGISPVGVRVDSRTVDCSC